MGTRVTFQQVYEWKFKIGVSNLANAARSGRSHAANRADPNAVVEEMIQENRPITIDEMSGELNIGHGSAYHIICKVLQHRNSPPDVY